MNPADPPAAAAGVAAAHATSTGEAAMETPGGKALRSPLILFGAFDRHNFGDLPVPHRLAARATDQPKLCPLIY